jgi:hypothetical protein
MEVVALFEAAPEAGGTAASQKDPQRFCLNS